MVSASSFVAYLHNRKDHPVFVRLCFDRLNLRVIGTPSTTILMGLHFGRYLFSDSHFGALNRFREDHVVPGSLYRFLDPVFGELHAFSCRSRRAAHRHR